MAKSKLFLYCLFIVIRFSTSFFIIDSSRSNLLSEIIRKRLVKRDVTVIQRGVGEPCPVLLEDNLNYGANVGWGPSLFGNFYGGGQSFNPNKGGFKSWGGNVGSNGMGIRRGLGVGVPVGARVLGPKQGNNCQDPPMQQQLQSQQMQQLQQVPPRQTQPGMFHDSGPVSGAGFSAVPQQQAQPQQSQITVIQSAPGGNWIANPAQPQTFYNSPVVAYRPFPG